MKNLLLITLFISLSFTIHNIAHSESKIANKIFGSKDCSQYSTKNFSGLSDYVKCKKGLDPSKEKNIFKFSKSEKNKSKEYNLNKSCDEYSTKTFASLYAKIKCKRQ